MITPKFCMKQLGVLLMIVGSITSIKLGMAAFDAHIMTYCTLHDSIVILKMYFMQFMKQSTRGLYLMIDNSGQIMKI